MLDEGAQCDGQLSALFQCVAELLRQRGRPLRTIGRILCETPIDRLGEAPWHERGDARERWRGLGDLLREHIGRLVRFERQRCRTREIADDAQRIEIAARIHDFAERLLGTHELGSTHHLARGKRAGARDHTRDPEIGDQHAAVVLEQDVVGLHIAMDHTLPMRVRERPGDVAQDARSFGGGERPAPPDALRQGLTLDVRHREEHKFADLFDGVNRDDVGVGEFRGGARLA